MRDRRTPEPLPAPRAAARGKKPSAELGDLPEWNLADLYPSMDSAELREDIGRAGEEAARFERRWKGTLAAEAARGSGGRLGEAVKAYEEIQELMGRIASYASLVYAGDTSDPKRAKLYGDIQEKMTDASAHLIFFELELNKIDDSGLDAALKADKALAHYRPWVTDLRKDKP
jgi:oligoendopeptidase F